MIQPTQEQIKELWKWCGLHYTEPYWLDAEGNLAFYGEVYSELLGTINLNILFEYPVPKAIKTLTTKYKYTDGSAYGKLFGDWMATCTNTDWSIPELTPLALFWVIWEVFHAKH